MALIERLMNDSSEPEERWLSVHEFYAACTEVAWGYLTSAQVKNGLEMTAADEVDWNPLVALAPTGDAGKAKYTSHIHAVLLFARANPRRPQYDTPALVRTKLGI